MTYVAPEHERLVCGAGFAARDSLSKDYSVMKIKSIIAASAALVLCALMSVSCEKAEVRNFKGSYSFKTSGTVSVTRMSGDTRTQLEIALSPESGQMNILATEGRSMVVTMNIVGGGVVVFDAEVNEDGGLTLSPATRSLSISDNARTVSLQLSVSGTAVKYDDVVVFDFDYAGNGETTSNTYEITASDVKCVAKLND